MENEKKLDPKQKNGVQDDELKEYKVLDQPEDKPEKKKGKSSRILKIVLWCAGVLLALLVLFVVFRDFLIVNGVRHIGTMVTGTKVEMESFKSSFNGSVEIKNIKVANPVGYRKPWAFEIDRIYVKLIPATLTTKEPVVEVVEVTGVRVDMEIKGTGHSNLTDIQKNVERFAGGAAADSGKKKSDAGSKKADPDAPAPLIRKIALTSMSISLSSSTLNSSVPMPLAPVYLENVGGKGAPIGDTLLKVFNNFMGSVNSVCGTFMGGIEALGNAGKSIKGSVSDGARSLNDGINRLFNRK